MDTSRLSRVNSTPAVLRGTLPSKTKDSSPDLPEDKVRLRGNETPKQLFAALKRLGKDPGRDAAARMLGSQKAGYESLIRFQGDEGLVVSLVNTHELADYVALASGSPATHDVQQQYSLVQQRLQAGDRFFLERDGDYLKTDAAGAALVLARGGPVVRLGLAGELDTWKAIPEQVEPSTPQRLALGKLLDRATQMGCEFELEPEQPDTSIKGKVMAVLRGKPDQAQLRGKLVDSLEKGSPVLLSLPDDERKIPLPSGVDAQQLDSFLQYVEAPTPEQLEFKSAFQDLQKKEAILLTRSNAGEIKGMLTQACDRSAYLNLVGGHEVVALARDGVPQRLTQVSQMKELNTTGSLAGADAPLFDGASEPSDNLFMVYHVSPFDPVNKGIYDDLVRRMIEVGSSKEIDIVAMHSDLPDKRNLRVDRVQSGRLESLKKLDPETVMSDPKTFEDFICETLLANQTDSKVRLFVGGHGGAEKGLLPDGKHNNAAANHAMSVDDFAGAIHKALDRVQAETGKRPFIENLMLCSCLMGNTSLIDALARTGDVGVLCASPEVMMGSSPNSVIEYLHNPEHSQASGEEFARYLVDTISEAPSAPGGNKESHHADTYGAYRLDKGLAQDFQACLNGFFQECLKRPDQAAALKRAIAACPTYGVNPFINLMFDVDNRDIIQVAERIVADARVTSQEIKEAAQKVIEKASAQVIAQKVSEKYEGRKGPTIYLPIDRFDFDEKMSQTAFLQGTDYSRFCEMIFDAPLHRGVQDTFLAEANRVAEALKEARSEGKSKETDEADNPEKTEETKADSKLTPASRGEVQQVHSVEEYRANNLLNKTARGIRALATGALGVAGGLALAAVGAIPGALLGGVLGLRAGFTGSSLVEHRYGAEDTSQVGPGTLKTVAKLATQAALFPMESAGLRAHEAAGFRHGTLVGRLAGSLAGLVGGAVGGALAGGAVGFVPGFLLARGTGRVATFWMPGQLPHKDHTKGLDSDLTTP